MSPLMRKVLILILLPLVILSTTMSFVTIYSINRFLVDKTFQELIDHARYESSLLENKIIEIETTTSVVSHTIGLQFDLQKYSDSGDIYISQFRDEIAQILLHTAKNTCNCKGLYFMFSPEYGSSPSRIWIHKKSAVDEFERIVEYPDIEDFDPDDPHMEYYYTPLKREKPFWSNPYIDKNTGESMISYTIPVWNNSKIIGIIGFNLSLYTVGIDISRSTFSDTGYAFLLGSDSNIIYHPFFSINTPVSEALGEELDFLKEELTSENPQNTAIYNFRNEAKRLGYKRLSNNWVLGITTFDREIFRPVILIRNILIAISSVILLITGIIAYFAARFISNPIILLTKEVKKSVQDLDSTLIEPLLLNRKDEIGNLSREFKEMQNAFQKVMKQVINNNVSLERLAGIGEQVGGFTHEIKTPIGVVLTSQTFTEDLLEELERTIESNNLKKSDLVDTIKKIREGTSLGRKNIEQAVKIINSFNNITVSQSDIRLEKIYLKNLIDDIDASISIGNKKKNIKIKNNIPHEVLLNSFSGYLTQVFTNLFQNSFNHGFCNKKNGQILINCRIEDNSIRIDYSDDGAGIPEENIENIFKPYYSSAKDRGGSGLGLHIIQTIVHNYLKGNIEYIKNKNPGVLFRITLPK